MTKDLNLWRARTTPHPPSDALALLGRADEVRLTSLSCSLRKAHAGAVGDLRTDPLDDRVWHVPWHHQLQQSRVGQARSKSRTSEDGVMRVLVVLCGL